METNAFYCSRCDKCTKHIEVSTREFAALNGDNTIVQAAGLFSDFTGISRLLKTISGNNCYKCMNCGRITVRDIKGEVIDVAKNS